MNNGIMAIAAAIILAASKKGSKAIVEGSDVFQTIEIKFTGYSEFDSENLQWNITDASYWTDRFHSEIEQLKEEHPELNEALALNFTIGYDEDALEAELNSSWRAHCEGMVASYQTVEEAKGCDWLLGKIEHLNEMLEWIDSGEYIEIDWDSITKLSDITSEITNINSLNGLTASEESIPDLNFEIELTFNVLTTTDYETRDAIIDKIIEFVDDELFDYCSNVTITGYETTPSLEDQVYKEPKKRKYKLRSI